MLMIERKNAFKILHEASNVVSVNQPGDKGVRIQTYGGRMSVRARRDGVDVELRQCVTGDDIGPVVVDPNRLKKVVKAKSKKEDSEVMLSVNDKSVVVSADGMAISVSVAEDQLTPPLIGEAEWSAIVVRAVDEFRADDLVEVLEYVLRAAAKDDYRTNLNIVTFEKLGGVVTTDGHRLAKVDGKEILGKVMISTEAAEILARLVKMVSPEVVFMCVSEDKEDDSGSHIPNLVRFYAGMENGLYFRLDTKEPDVITPQYKHVIPDNDGKWSFKISGEKLRTAVEKMISVIDGLNGIGIETEECGDLVTLSHVDMDGQRTAIKIEAMETVCDGKVSLNPKYLLDAIKTGASSDVVFQAGEAADPVKILVDLDCGAQALGVVMPTLL